MSENNTRVYELGFLLAPTISENEVGAHLDTLKGMVTAVEGEILSVGDLEYIDLAYRMEKTIGSKKLKYSQGYFGSLKFQALPEALEALKKALDGSSELIRYILIKTTVQNTIVFKKPKIEAKRDGAAPLEDEEVVIEDDADLKEDHELLPDVQADIESAPAAEEEEM